MCERLIAIGSLKILREAKRLCWVPAVALFLRGKNSILRSAHIWEVTLHPWRTALEVASLCLRITCIQDLPGSAAAWQLEMLAPIYTDSSGNCRSSPAAPHFPSSSIYIISPISSLFSPRPVLVFILSVLFQDVFNGSICIFILRYPLIILFLFLFCFCFLWLGFSV